MNTYFLKNNKVVLVNPSTVEQELLEFPAQYDTVVESVKSYAVGATFSPEAHRDLEVAFKAGQYVKHVETAGDVTLGRSYIDPSYVAVYDKVSGFDWFMQSRRPNGVKRYYKEFTFDLPEGIKRDEVVFVAELNGELEWYLDLALHRLAELNIASPFYDIEEAKRNPIPQCTRDIAISLHSNEQVVGYLLSSKERLTAQGVDTSVVLPKPMVSITPRQLRRQLLKDGLLSQVESTIESLPEPTRSEVKIDFEYATVINRYDPFTIQLSSALGLSSEQVDEMFIQAAQI